MNPTVFLVILGQLSFVFSAISDDEYRLETLCSSPALEHFDITPILKNDRLVSSYFKCFMDEGPCTNEGKMVKRIIPEIMRTQCRNCNPTMRRIVRTVMKHMFQTRPRDVDDFFLKYDPHEMYYDDLIEFMDEDNDY
ncbi:ejaculatory bulb-specific protein 3 [Bemisia tabaci]